MENLIFKPTYEGLLKAKEKRENKWKELDQRKFTKDEELERMRIDIEVFESMGNVRERAMQCLRKSKNR